MSTNPQDLNPKESSEATITKNKKVVDRSIRTLMQEMEHENTLVAETPSGRLQRVLKIYRYVKPLLSTIAALRLIPSGWRAAFVMFTEALEALSESGSDLAAQFKAGKDLAEQE